MIGPENESGTGFPESGTGFTESGAGATAPSRNASDRLSHLSESTSVKDRTASSPRLTTETGSDSGVLETYVGLPAFALLQHAAESVAHRPAILYAGESWTYRDLNADSIRCAAMLQRLGVKAGDRVGILLPNIPEFIVAANAIWRAGGIVLAISPLMVASEVSDLIRKTKCRYVICLDLLAELLDGIDDSDGELLTLLVSIRKRLPAHKQLGYLFRRGYQWIRSRPSNGNRAAGWFWDEINKTRNPLKEVEIDSSNDPAYILPTGGTTGNPKAVTLSHENMVANAWQQAQWNRGSFATETMLGVLPFFHSYGMSATVMGGAAMAATLVLHHRFNTSQVIRLIETHRPTVFHAVPAMLAAMNGRLRSRQRNQLDSLRWVISGGAPLEESIAREFASFCGNQQVKVVEGYGLSEASPVTHVGDLYAAAQYGSIGLPLPHTECRIVDTASTSEGDLIDVSGENVGELCIRGPQVMLGYWGDPDATKNALREGWLRTGDLAIRRSDGYYKIVGRIKDLIITSGFNVYPSEVEAVLREAPGVKDAAVIGIPDDARGEIVHAYLVPDSNATISLRAVEAHCRKYLSAHKRPRGFTSCEVDLPRNFLGKVIRRKLREDAS